MFNKIAAAIAGPSRSPATSTQTMASRANVLVEALKDPAQQRSCHNQSKALSKELGALGEAHFGVFAQARPALQKVLQATQGDPAYEHLHQAAGTCDQRMLPVLFAAMSRQGDALMPTFTALRASPNGAVRGAIESLILGRHPGDAMAATRPPSPPQVPVEPAARPRPAASAGWLGSLSPRAILHGAFDEKEPAMRGLSTSERRALRTFTDGIVATQEGQNEALKFLAFVTNTAEAAPDAAADEGMHSPAAISMMLKSLYTAASQATLSPEEKVLVKRLLNDYRNLFISSAINKYFGKSKSYASHEEHMRRVVLQMAFAPKGGGLLSTGFSGHATVTRVATMDESSRRHQDVSRGLGQYRQAIAATLGSVSERVANSYQLGMTPELFEDPGIQALITRENWLLWPGSQPGSMRLTRRNTAGELVHYDFLASDVDRWLPKRGVANLIGNGVKMTVHNGGAGAVFAKDGTTLSFSNRLTVPLVETADVLVTMMSAKLQGYDKQGEFLTRIMGYERENLQSSALSPPVPGQTLGNCTVHSQKLALLYHLQHPKERGSELSENDGTRLFTKLWSGVLDVAASARRELPRGSVPHKNTESALGTERQWLDRVANPHSKPKPLPAAKPAPRVERAPSRATPSIAEAMALLQKEHRAQRVAGRHAEPKLANVSPEVLANMQGVAQIADWDPHGSSGDSRVLALTRWARQTRGQWWEPSTLQELEGFTRLMDSIKSGMLNSRSMAVQRNWLDGGNHVKDAFAALDGPEPPTLPQLRSALFAYLNDERSRTDGSDQPGPMQKLRDAWGAAAQHDPLLAQMHKALGSL